jgi:uncharacterized protein (DUF1501 family)
MLTRRQLLTRSLQGSSLLAFGSMVPQFVADTARAAEAGKDTILVIVEFTGGNDGLNTVIPHADDLYQKARKTLRLTKQQVVKVTDDVGLNPGMASFRRLLDQHALAIVQGVGYPNPDRSHFESMDIWHLADPTRKRTNGWIGRCGAELQDNKGDVPLMHIGAGRLPVALTGAPGGALSINNRQAFKLNLGGGTEERHKARRKLIDELSAPAREESESLLQFVQRRQVQTLTSLDRLQDVLRGSDGGRFNPGNNLSVKLDLIARLIQRGFGTRVFYVTKDGFDTHAEQLNEHRNLLADVADGIANFFETLKQMGHDKRVRVMTFSEFGRRVQENGSKGTDHGAASCLFVAGPSLKASGLVGAHPSLKDLDAGDLKYHTDFRRVYATLLDHWLGCDSAAVLGGDRFEHLDALKRKA